MPAGDIELAGALLRIQHAAYAVEARLIGDDRIPPLHETLDDLRAAPLTWLAASVDGTVVGAVAWTEEPDTLDIDRLLVSPSAHRQGVGSALVRAVLSRATGRRTLVSTGRDNRPARALYERLGFTHTHDDEVIPRLWIAHYTHNP